MLPASIAGGHEDAVVADGQRRRARDGRTLNLRAYDHSSRAVRSRDAERTGQRAPQILLHAAQLSRHGPRHAPAATCQG